MPTAEEVANLLSYEFLRNGNYSASSGPVEVPDLRQAAAVADDGDDRFVLAEQPAFASLQVQSVGFECGVPNPKVHIYLARGSKASIRALSREIGGVPVVADKMGLVTVRPEMAAASTNHGNHFMRGTRVCCGSSCGPTSERSSGTLGALVKIVGSAQLYILSNNHVLAGCNHVSRNQPILSPSSDDGGAFGRAPGEVARHDKIHELRSGDPIFVNPCDTDMALARVSDRNILSSWQGNAANGYDTPTTVREPVSLMRVKKFGRTTALTTGEVEARVTSPMPVTYNSKHFKGRVWFKDVWTVRGIGGPFALPGDSGSLVVTENANAAVGLVFAASPGGDFAWIVPMPCAVAGFGGLQLVGRHGV